VSPKTPKNPKEAELKKRVAKLPIKPGVYRWLDGRGKVLYVGKAKNLRNRVKSYLQKDAAHGPWKIALMQSVRDLDVTVTRTELEALILETNLIKQHKPKYNVLMKDDKNYLFIRITVQDPFPRIDMIRKPLEDGSKYFGPYTRGFEMNQTLTMLRKIFPYRNCKMSIEPEAMNQQLITNNQKTSFPVAIKHRDRPTPCLDYHIKQCSAPCIGNITPEEYRRDAIDPVIDYLKGNTQTAVELLEGKMRDAARARKFERAGKLRDALKMLQGLEEKHVVSDASGEDADIWAVALASGRAHVVLLKERGGKVIAEESMALAGQAETRTEVLAQILPQFYATSPEIPATLIIGEILEELHLLEAMFSRERGTKVTIITPERGKKHQLLDLAQENADEKVQQFETKWEAAARNIEEALQELKEKLNLPAIPKRIEGYDISHHGGTETVGSMVVTVDGKPKNEHYRSFTIKTLSSGDVDDYRSLQEVLKRRLLHLKQNLGQEEREWKRQGIRFGKAKMDEMETLVQLMRDEPEGLSLEDIVPEDFLMARDGDTIIAFGRLLKHSPKEVELKSIWVRNEHRHKGLGTFMIRKLLDSARRKKWKKVYLRIFLKMEEFYAALGFCRLQSLPPVLGAKIEKIRKTHPGVQGAAMVYIFAEHAKNDPSLSARPDLIVLDGGKGQLSSVVEVCKELSVTIPVIALAKEREEVFVPGDPRPMVFVKDSPARFLLQRLRDEAHRSANRHREARKGKVFLASSLDDLPGIGPQTRTALLQKFGSLEGMKEATDEELLTVLNEGQLKAVRGME